MPGPVAAGLHRPIEIRMIWDDAPHSAFTDRIRFHDQRFWAFRVYLAGVEIPPLA